MEYGLVPDSIVAMDASGVDVPLTEFRSPQPPARLTAQTYPHDFRFLHPSEHASLWEVLMRLV